MLRKYTFLYIFLCFSLLTVATRLDAQCQVSIVQDKQGGCPPSSVAFELTGVQPDDRFIWIVGGDSIHAGSRLQHIFNKTGSYDVSVKVNRPDGTSCVVHKPAAVTITDGPVIKGLTASRASICRPDTVTLFADVEGAVQYDWIVEGQNYTDAGKRITHHFNSPGYQDITLRVKDKFGCYMMRTFHSVVYMKYYPQIKIVSDVQGGCIPYQVDYKADVTPGESPIASYEWYFENAEPSVTYSWDPGPVKYSVPGEHKVVLKVRTSDGCEYVFKKESATSAGVPVELNFSADTTEGHVGDTFTVTNLTPMTDGKFEWRIPEARFISYSGKEVKIVFNFTGEFDVNLHYGHYGCKKALYKPLYLKVKPRDTVDKPNPCRGFNASFSIPETHCLGKDIKIANPGSGAGYRYKWFAEVAGVEFLPSDTHANPVIRVHKAGAYNIKLVKRNENGCVAQYGRHVKVYDTKVSFSSPDTVNNCAPAYVRFEVTATDVDSFFWFFGDGTSLATTSRTIAHLYQKNSGSLSEGFDVKVLAKNNSGCTDTFVRYKYIKVRGPVPSFEIVSARKGTDSLKVWFENTSENVEDFYFDYGDNSPFDSNAMHPHTYKITDPSADFQVFRPRLFVNDMFGCASVYESNDSIVVYRRPQAKFDVSSLSTCGNVPVTFTDRSLYAVKWYWDLDSDGTIDDTSRSPSRELAPGTYRVSLIAENGAGEKDTFTYPGLIYVMALPVASFTQDQAASCMGDVVLFTASKPHNSDSLQYSWGINDEPWTAFSPEPYHSRRFDAPGEYDIKLIVRNSNDCTDTLIKRDAITILDELPPAPPSIKLVSRQEDGSIRVSWDPSKEAGIRYHHLYRVSDNGPELIHTAKGQETAYTDQPAPGKVSYYLTAEDICGYTSASSKEHSPVEMQLSFSPDSGMRLSWTAYQGWDNIQAYHVYRKEADGQYKRIAQLGPGANTYTDNNLCNAVYCYYITAESMEGYVSRSNISCQKSYTETKPVSIYQASVDGQGVNLEWQPAPLKRIKTYVIDKYTETGRWRNGIFYTQQTTWTDLDADVNTYSYTYRVRALDSCGNVTDYVNTANTILLTSGYADGKIWLKWNTYARWEKGVKEYLIQAMNGRGGYDIIGATGPRATTFIVDEQMVSMENEQHFRVVAVENAAEPHQSLSNVSSTTPPSILHVPNAFTPNGDGLNDEFKVMATAIHRSSGNGHLDFDLRVYDRWGGLVFSGNDINKGWDGTIDGMPAAEGVYTYSVYAVGKDNQHHKIKGTVSLFRSFAP